MEIEQMVGNFAEKLFLGQQNGYKRLNCAQAIAEAFRQEYNFLTEDTIKDFKKMGHGKAPNGECGMLFAAKYIFQKNNHPDKAQEFEKHLYHWCRSHLFLLATSASLGYHNFS